MNEKEARRLILKHSGGIPYEGEEKQGLSDYGKWLVAQGYLEATRKADHLVCAVESYLIAKATQSDIETRKALIELDKAHAKWEKEK